ncbi:hypothetical protein GF312_04875 [Candidatus Poribacteria bacterium]|nr:hypothetical protein [Candidatus Poribacteria bacterium]
MISKQQEYRQVQIDISSIIPFPDILIVGTIILFAFRGLKRGVLNALFSTLRIYFSFIIAILLYETIALPIHDKFKIPLAPLQSIIFILLFGLFMVIIWFIMAMLINRIVNPPENATGLDRAGGTAMGVIEGILIVSIIIMGIDLYFSPMGAKSPLEKGISYNFIEPIAPAIKNFTIKPTRESKELIGDAKKSEFITSDFL